MREPRYPLPRVIVNTKMAPLAARAPSPGRQGARSSDHNVPWRVPRRGLVVLPAAGMTTCGRARRRVPASEEEEARGGWCRSRASIPFLSLYR